MTTFPPARFGSPIRPSVQTPMEWAQVGRFDPSGKLTPDGSEIVRNPCEIDVWTLGRIGEQYPVGKLFLEESVRRNLSSVDGKPLFRLVGP
jgi:hypothetical protein